MNSPNKIGDYFSRRFPFFTIFSNASYPELALIIVLLRLIVQILIICAAIVGVGFAMGSGGSDSSSSGPAPGSTQWIDAEGGRHNSEWDAKAANKRIAERKATS